MAAENASAIAPLRMTREGAGRGRCFLAATRSGTARPDGIRAVLQLAAFACLVVSAVAHGRQQTPGSEPH
jgi:hypothetical protein